VPKVLTVFYFVQYCEVCENNDNAVFREKSRQRQQEMQETKIIVKDAVQYRIALRQHCRGDSRCFINELCKAVSVLPRHFSSAFSPSHARTINFTDRNDCIAVYSCNRLSWLLNSFWARV